MMHWNDLNDQLGLFLSDPGGVRHKDALRALAWNSAQRFMAKTHTAMEKAGEFALVGDTPYSFALPSDLIDIGAVYSSELMRFLRPMRFVNGGSYQEGAEDIPAFWTWGSTLVCEAQSAGSVRLYYFADWPEVVLDGAGVCTEGNILVPTWSLLPLMHLAAAIVLQPMAIESARNREFNIDFDSGKPTDNSRAQQANEHWTWWGELMGRVPPQARYGITAR